MWMHHFIFTETQRIGNSHLRKVSVSESNVLLDEEVLTDPKIQALLLTVLVRTHLTWSLQSSNQWLLLFISLLLTLRVKRLFLWFSRPPRSNTPLMTLTSEFCTSTWLKLALSSQRFFQLCKYPTILPLFWLGCGLSFQTFSKCLLSN